MPHDFNPADVGFRAEDAHTGAVDTTTSIYGYEKQNTTNLLTLLSMVASGRLDYEMFDDFEKYASNADLAAAWVKGGGSADPTISTTHYFGDHSMSVAVATSVGTLTRTIAVPTRDFSIIDHFSFSDRCGGGAASYKVRLIDEDGDYYQWDMTTGAAGAWKVQSISLHDPSSVHETPQLNRITSIQIAELPIDDTYLFDWMLFGGYMVLQIGKGYLGTDDSQAADSSIRGHLLAGLFNTGGTVLPASKGLRDLISIQYVDAGTGNPEVENIGEHLSAYLGKGTGQALDANSSMEDCVGCSPTMRDTGLAALLKDYVNDDTDSIYNRLGDATANAANATTLIGLLDLPDTANATIYDLLIDGAMAAGGFGSASTASLDDMLGGFSGDGGAAQDDSIKASLDLAHIDLDTLITEVGQIPQSDGAVSWNATALAAIENEALDALISRNIDHLAATAIGAVLDTVVVDDSIIGHSLASSDVSTYVRTTDSQQAISDKLGGFTGDGGVDQGDSAKANLDIIDTEIGNLATEVGQIPQSDGAVSWNATALQALQDEAEDALEGENLDHYAAAAMGAALDTIVGDDTLLGYQLAKSDVSTYDRTTDSQQAISDKEGGFSGDGGAEQDDSVKASLDLAHTDLDSILTNVDKIPASDGADTWNATALASIEAEATDAIEADNLDHLAAAESGTDDYPLNVVDNSIIAHICAIGGDISEFDDDDDSLQAISEKIDAVQGGAETIQSLSDELDAQLDLARSTDSGDVVMDGTEKTLYEEDGGSYPFMCLGGSINWTGLNAGAGEDTIIKGYKKLKSGGAYVEFYKETFLGAALPDPLDTPVPRNANTDCVPLTFPNTYGVKFTATQAAIGGGWNTIASEWYDEKRS